VEQLKNCSKSLRLNEKESTQRQKSLTTRLQKTTKKSIVDKENSNYEMLIAERWASLSAKRFEDESFKEYKERMRGTKQLLKAYMRGRRMTAEEYAKSK